MSVTVLASAALIAAASVPAADFDLQDTSSPATAVEQVQTPVAQPAAPVAPSAPMPAPTIVLPPSIVGSPTTAAPAPTLDQISQPQDAIVVSGEREVPQDPIQAVNEASYNAVQAVDGALIAPLAEGYEKAVPAPVRKGLRNFLRNLTEPVVALNFLLQLKPGKAAETLGRFALNSTIGVAGLIDVAEKKPFNLPYRRNGFAYTFGYHGIGPGPYFFLPLVGPTTLRDVVGLGLDRFLMPFAVGGPLKHPAYVYGGFVVRSLDDRVENDELFARIREESNPYASYRELYLKSRQAEIDALKGKADFQREGSVVLTPAAATAVPAAAPVPAPVPVAVPQEPAPIVFASEPVVQPLP